MKQAKDLKIEKVKMDIQTPLAVMGGVLIGNLGTNTFLPKLINVSGLEGLGVATLGREMTTQTINFLKVVLPTAVGLVGIQLFEKKHAKNVAIGITGSGLLNAANLLLKSKVPELARKVLTVQGLGSDKVEIAVKPQSVPEVEQMVNEIDRQLTKMGAIAIPESTGEIDFSDDTQDEIDFNHSDDFGFTEDVDYQEVSTYDLS
jgi:hypothetical protein